MLAVRFLMINGSKVPASSIWKSWAKEPVWNARCVPGGLAACNVMVASNDDVLGCTCTACWGAHNRTVWGGITLEK